MEMYGHGSVLVECLVARRPMLAVFRVGTVAIYVAVFSGLVSAGARAGDPSDSGGFCAGCSSADVYHLYGIGACAPASDGTPLRRRRESRGLG